MKQVALESFLKKKHNLGGVYMRKKTSRLKPDQPSASVSWDNFNFCLHEQFRPGLQG